MAVRELTEEEWDAFLAEEDAYLEFLDLDERATAERDARQESDVDASLVLR